MKSKIKHLFQDSSTYFLVSIISAGISFVTLPIYTRFLSPSDFGIIALFFTFGMISTGLVSLGIKNATYRYYFKLKNNTEEFITLNSTNITFLVFVFALSGVLLYFISEFVSDYLFDGVLPKQIVMLSFLGGCLAHMYEYFTLLLTAQKKAKIYAIITILMITIDTVLSFYFIFAFSLTYMARIYASIITHIMVLLVVIAYSIEFISFEFSFDRLKKSVTFSFPLIPRKIIGLTYKSFDKLMLNNFSGLVSVGYYTFGVKFATLIKHVMDSIGKSWNPYFLEKASENTENAKDEIVWSFFTMSFLIMSIGLCIIYFSEEMIKFYPAMYVVPIYVYYFLFDIIGMLSVNQIIYAEKLFFLLPTSIVSVIFNILLNIFLIPKYGFIGASISTVISAFLSVLVTFYYGNKFYPLPIKKIKILRLYLMIILFTIPIYPIMFSDIHFVIKIIVKLILLFLFIITGIVGGYIDFSVIVRFFKSFTLNSVLSKK